MKKVLPFIFVGALVIALIWTSRYLYSKSQEKPVVFKTDHAAMQNIVRKTVATGSIIPRKEIAVKPRVSGIVNKLYVEPGQVISKGTLLAKITIIPDLAALNNAENRLSTAKINLTNTEKELKRYEALLEKGVIAEAEIVQYRLDYKLRKEEVATAENNVQIIKEGASKKGGASNLVYSTVSGMILDVPVKEGASVIESNTFNEGTSIAVVANMKDLIFQGKVDESEVGKIREGMDLSITIGAIEKERFEGELKYISPKGVLEEGAIQYEIKADVQLKKGFFIRAGYSANADIILEQKDSVLAVKESLVSFEKDGTAFVEVETSPQQFEKKNLKLGLSDGINIEVLDGITLEDKIKVKEDYGKMKKGHK